MDFMSLPFYLVVLIYYVYLFFCRFIFSLVLNINLSKLGEDQSNPTRQLIYDHSSCTSLIVHYQMNFIFCLTFCSTSICFCKINEWHCYNSCYFHCLRRVEQADKVRLCVTYMSIKEGQMEQLSSDTKPNFHDWHHYPIININLVSKIN